MAESVRGDTRVSLCHILGDDNYENKQKNSKENILWW